MKHFTLRKLRPLALTLGLVLCFGLFAGCSSQDGEPSQDPSQVVTESPSPRVDPSDEPTTGLPTMELTGMTTPLASTTWWVR